MRLFAASSLVFSLSSLASFSRWFRAAAPRIFFAPTGRVVSASSESFAGPKDRGASFCGEGEFESVRWRLVKSCFLRAGVSMGVRRIYLDADGIG